MRLFSLIKTNKCFFICFLILVLLTTCLLVFIQKQQLFILLNQWHSTSLDNAFIFLTMLGNGWCIIIIGAVCLLAKLKKLGILILSSFLLSGILAQFLKFLIPEARPGILLENSGYPFFLNNVTLHSYSSFPSGHTASAFALASSITFYWRNKWMAIPLFIYACLVGYSRIYIGDHFLGDVVAGALLGVLSASACYMYFSRDRSMNNLKTKDL